MDSVTRTTSSHWGAFEATTCDDRIVSVDAFSNDLSPSSVANALPEAPHQHQP